MNRSFPKSVLVFVQLGTGLPTPRSFLKFCTYFANSNHPLTKVMLSSTPSHPSDACPSRHLEFRILQTPDALHLNPVPLRTVGYRYRKLEEMNTSTSSTQNTHKTPREHLNTLGTSQFQEDTLEVVRTSFHHLAQLACHLRQIFPHVLFLGSGRRECQRLAHDKAISWPVIKQACAVRMKNNNLEGWRS